MRGFILLTLSLLCFVFRSALAEYVAWITIGLVRGEPFIQGLAFIFALLGLGSALYDFVRPRRSVKSPEPEGRLP